MAIDSTSTRPKPFVFVLMPFDQKFDDIYKFGIQGAAEDVGAYAERVDEQIFIDGMLDRIFNQISKADVIVADMTGRNPNVFYEVGYAHALDKLVLLLTQDSGDIPFDLKHHQHTVYSGKIDLLRNDLANKLQWAITESQRRSDRVAAEFISVIIFDQPLMEGIDNDSSTHIYGGVKDGDVLANLPVQIRNESADTLSPISYVYLFTKKGIPVVPGKTTSNILSSRTTIPGKSKLIPLESLLAHEMDAPDDLIEQYRLPISVPSLPPGAVEKTKLL